MEMSALESANSLLYRNIEHLRSAVTAIYSTNDLFEYGLSIQTEADRLNRISSAMNLLKLQMQTGGQTGGLMMYYDDVKPVLYYMDNAISYRDQEMLNRMGKSLETESFMVRTSVVDGEDDSYYFMSMKKPGSKICGFISFDAAVGEASGQTRWGYVSGGEFHWLPGQAFEDLSIDASALSPGANRLGVYTAYLQRGGTADAVLVRVVRERLGRWIAGVHVVLAVSLLLILILFLRVRRFALRELSVPLVDMKETLSHLQGGEWDADFKAPNRIQEIEDVRDTINVMLKSIEQYKNRVYEERMERQRTQLQYAQLQLAPHFYTNCMKNAYYMLQLKEYDTLERFLLCLSNHLRYLLQTNREFVTLREEKAFVENYIELQQQLTQREINCRILIEDGDLDILIPILALQTFVENSVKYAKDNRRERLAMYMKVARLNTEAGERLNISYADHGAGYPEAVLAMLNQQEPTDKEGLGVGIVNLLKRCRFHYGDQVTWAFYNDEGAVSELILPIERSCQAEGDAQK